MIWSEVNLKGVNTMRRMQWMLSMLAIVVCLFSVGSLHSHESGLHVLDSACISCDLENVTSHGAAISAVPTKSLDLSDVAAVVSQQSITVATTRSSAPIRAPPIYS
ncbi:hypothetical protein F3F96_07005 [Mariprofundus sp. NF]|uniref:hypothetical protein n=1 Tax=Mariprofundus sp. NF TaxID=2608716 RepID=UPI0015A06249|nr:hypothetical protein [Mariprofundus sp. NF]NWF38882.1 hypothetical protein [Mariprofundus sp. NF]